MAKTGNGKSKKGSNGPKSHKGGNQNNQNKQPSRQPIGVGVANGSNMQVVNAPISTFTERRSYFKVNGAGRFRDSIRISGQDYIGTVAWNTTSAAGATLANYLICPGSGIFNNTRLQRFAQLYEKYVFRKLRFHWQSSSGTTASGSYILAYDKDPSDPTPPPSEDGVRQFLAMQGSRSGHVWESLSIDCPLTDSQDFYYTNPSDGGDERLSYQGQLYAAVLITINANTNLSLWVEYDIELMDPQLEPAANEAQFTATSGNTSSTASAGFNSLTVANALNSPLIRRLTDSAGNSFIRVPQGNWLIEQAVNFSGTTPGILNMVSANITGTGTAITPSALSNSQSNWGSSVNSNAYRLDRVVAPADGADIFGNFSAINAIGQQTLRVFNTPLSNFV